MRSHVRTVAIGFMLFSLSLPLHAETDLSGEWSGLIKGVQVDPPTAPRSPFAASQDQTSATESAPRFVEATLGVTIKVQQDELLVGTWHTENHSQQFVCALPEADTWHCIDGANRATVKVMSGDQIKICYLDQAKGRQGAGCGVLSKVQ